MIKPLEDAIDRLKALPAERQAFALVVLEDILSAETFIVPADHRSAVLEGLAQAQRGERASADEMNALWAKCGL